MSRRRVAASMVVGILFSRAAESAPFELNIEPIVGYEQVQQVLPTKHSTNRLIYGGRVTAGILLLSVETEYTHGMLTETYSNTTQQDTGDRLKVGLRSGFNLGSFLRWYLRGGGQGIQEQVSQTTNGVTTNFYQPFVIKPYIGTGLRLAISHNIIINVDIVEVVTNFSDFSQNDYQTTAGFTIKLP